MVFDYYESIFCIQMVLGDSFAAKKLEVKFNDTQDLDQHNRAPRIVTRHLGCPVH